MNEPNAELEVKPEAFMPNFPSPEEIDKAINAGEAHRIEKDQYSNAVDKSTLETFNETWKTHAFHNCGKRYLPPLGCNECDNLTPLGRYPRKPKEKNNLWNLPGVAALVGKFEGTPIIVVGCGPSLEKNIQHLESAQKEGFSIWVCDNALKTVLAFSKVVPDLVLFMDAQEEVKLFFKAEPEHPAEFRRKAVDTSELVGVFFAGTHPKVLDAWEGPKFIYLQTAAPGIESLLAINNELQYIHGELTPGTCVQSVGMSLGMMTRTPAIIFVGIDFSFPNGQQYAFRPEQMPPYFLTIDIHGNQVGTILPFIRSRDWMYWSMRLRPCNLGCMEDGHYKAGLMNMMRLGFGVRDVNCNGQINVHGDTDLLNYGKICDGCPQQKTFINATEGGILGLSLGLPPVESIVSNQRDSMISDNFCLHKDYKVWLDAKPPKQERLVYKGDGIWGIEEFESGWPEWETLQGRKFSEAILNNVVDSMQTVQRKSTWAAECGDLRLALWIRTRVVPELEWHLQLMTEKKLCNFRIWPLLQAMEVCKNQPWFRKSNPKNEIRKALEEGRELIKKRMGIRRHWS